MERSKSLLTGIQHMTNEQEENALDRVGLHRPAKVTHFRMTDDSSEATKRFETACNAVKTLLECMGEDPDREGLLATPSRVAKSLLFLTSGYQASIEEIVNNAIFHEGHTGMVIIRDIEIHSFCGHHLLPFSGKVRFVKFAKAYPKTDYSLNRCTSAMCLPTKIIGLSKLPRIAEMFARRLQVQERLTNEVANAIMEVLMPQGVGVVMEASHMCMMMRGVEKGGSTTVTRSMLGCFQPNPRMCDELFSLIGSPKV